MPNPTGPASSALSEIKERGYRKGTAPGLRAGQLADYAADDIPRLVAAIEAADAALKRHMQWFESAGVKICGGCLRPSPCPDTDVIAAALAGKEAGDGS